VRWEFGTPIVYNKTNGAIFHEIELTALPGRVAIGVDPQISTSYSLNGLSWSQPKYIRIGSTGNREKRLVWRQQGFMRNWRVQRFQGDSDSHLSAMNLEIRVEPLAY
jgi:hypothetical protein